MQVFILFQWLFTYNHTFCFEFVISLNLPTLVQLKFHNYKPIYSCGKKFIYSSGFVRLSSLPHGIIEFSVYLLFNFNSFVFSFVYEMMIIVNEVIVVLLKKIKRKRKQNNNVFVCNISNINLWIHVKVVNSWGKYFLVLWLFLEAYT